MPLAIEDIDTLNSYIAGVMERADHHAQNVSTIALGLVGPILWRKDADPIEVMAREGETKNVLWVKIGGQRYALSYVHADAVIELRRGTTQGQVIAQFSNDSSIEDIVEVFRGL